MHSHEGHTGLPNDSGTFRLNSWGSFSTVFSRVREPDDDFARFLWIVLSISIRSSSFVMGLQPKTSRATWVCDCVCVIGFMFVFGMCACCELLCACCGVYGWL